MALEESEYGIGSSTNIATPAGYPIVLSLLHSLGPGYLTAGRLINLAALLPLLYLIGASASRAAGSATAGLIAVLLTASLYHTPIVLAMPYYDLLAFSLVLPMVYMGFREERTGWMLFFAGLLSGLACSIRYNFLLSFAPLSMLFAVFAPPLPKEKRLRDALCIVAGITLGLTPEIIFSLRAGHVPFRTANKHYLLQAFKQTNFMLNRTQLGEMPSTLSFFWANRGALIPLYLKQLFRVLSIWAAVPLALWGIAEFAGRLSGKSPFDGRTRRTMAALIILISLLLAIFSLRPNISVAYPFIVMLSALAFIAVGVCLSKIAAVGNLARAVVFASLLIVSVLQMSSAHGYLKKYRQVMLTYNDSVASLLWSYGIRDSSEVMNLYAPLHLFWTYGDKSPLLYYTPLEPGWLSLTNSLPEKRPFIYEPTTGNMKNFKAVIVPYGFNSEFLESFKPVAFFPPARIFTVMEFPSQLPPMTVYFRQ